MCQLLAFIGLQQAQSSARVPNHEFRQNLRNGKQLQLPPKTAAPDVGK